LITISRLGYGGKDNARRWRLSLEPRQGVKSVNGIGSENRNGLGGWDRFEITCAMWSR